jgi:hypothetical protein
LLLLAVTETATGVVLSVEEEEFLLLLMAIAAIDPTPIKPKIANAALESPSLEPSACPVESF